MDPNHRKNVNNGKESAILITETFLSGKKFWCPVNLQLHQTLEKKSLILLAATDNCVLDYRGNIEEKDLFF